jgi:hypothetical protein
MANTNTTKTIEENAEVASTEVAPASRVVPNAELDSISKKTGKEINKQEKVRIKIPIDQLNKTDLVVPVCINGYIWEIKSGESVSVPKAVCDILTDAGII